MHSETHFGYEANSKIYNYHGEFQEDGNLLTSGKSSLYALGDIEVDCGIKDRNILQPDRLFGTFELGIRQEDAPQRFRELFYRHQSAHCLDQFEWPEAMFEMFGVRFRSTSGRATIFDSLAYYNRRVYLDYAGDAQMHITYHVSGDDGHEFNTDLDLHAVSHADSITDTFLDYAIEPSKQLSKRFALYAVYGLRHDVEKPHGETDHTTVFGIKISM